MRIYVASSWRNPLQPWVVLALRSYGHIVYDFRNPPNGTGFGWEQVNPNWKRTDGLGKGETSPITWREMLKHPIARAGYYSDKDAIDWCDVVLYLLPCGKSASWELGYAAGKGKKLYVLALEPTEPELMFYEANILVSMDEFLLFALNSDPPLWQENPPSPLGGF